MQQPDIEQHQLARKDMLTLALLLRPGEDFAILGSWSDPQILMDLSQAELAYGQHILDLLRPAIEAATEAQLIAALTQKMHLMGDDVSRIFDALTPQEKES